MFSLIRYLLFLTCVIGSPWIGSLSSISIVNFYLITLHVINILFSIFDVLVKSRTSVSWIVWGCESLDNSLLDYKFLSPMRDFRIHQVFIKEVQNYGHPVYYETRVFLVVKSLRSSLWLPGGVSPPRSFLKRVTLSSLTTHLTVRGLSSGLFYVTLTYLSTGSTVPTSPSFDLWNVRV